MGRIVTKEEYAKTVSDYAFAGIVIDGNDDVGYTFQHTSTGYTDPRTFSSRANAHNAAEYYVQHNRELMEIGQADAREWMKHNGYTVADE